MHKNPYISTVNYIILYGYGYENRKYRIIQGLVNVLTKECVRVSEILAIDSVRGF